MLGTRWFRKHDFGRLDDGHNIVTDADVQPFHGLSSDDRHNLLSAGLETDFGHHSTERDRDHPSLQLVPRAEFLQTQTYLGECRKAEATNGVTSSKKVQGRQNFRSNGVKDVRTMYKQEYRP